MKKLNRTTSHQERLSTKGNIMAILTATQKIERAHVSIMQSKLFRFYSGLTMIGKVLVSNDVPTAGTDGRDVWYGTEFIERLNNKQVLFIVLHELSHIAWRHTTTWKHLYKKDAVLANCACDFVINLQLLDQDPDGREIEFPTDKDGKPMGCLDEKYRGMDAQQVFDLLKKEYGTGEKYVEAEGDCDQFDMHDFENAEKMTEAEKQALDTQVQQALHQGKQLAGKWAGKCHVICKDWLSHKLVGKKLYEIWLKLYVKVRAIVHGESLARSISGLMCIYL